MTESERKAHNLGRGFALLLLERVPDALGLFGDGALLGRGAPLQITLRGFIEGRECTSVKIQPRKERKSLRCAALRCARGRLRGGARQLRSGLLLLALQRRLGRRRLLRGERLLGREGALELVLGGGWGAKGGSKKEMRDET